jgi:uncharacterized membrane protein
MMWGWLRRTFIAGFFVTVPLAVSLIALVWSFRLIDGLASGPAERLFGRHIPGLGIAIGTVLILVVGALARNMFGRRILQKGEQLLLHVPLFSAIYQPVKQLLAAFAPDNEYGFKHVVLVTDPAGKAVMGFLTKEFTVQGPGGEATPMAAVYVPTNHLYLGDVVICRPDQVSYPDLTVEQGIRIFLTGGMALPERMRKNAGSQEQVDR